MAAAGGFSPAAAGAGAGAGAAEAGAAAGGGGAGEVYCVCRTSDVTGTMLECDFCQDWFHVSGVGFDEFFFVQQPAVDVKPVKKPFQGGQQLVDSDGFECSWVGRVWGRSWGRTRGKMLRCPRGVDLPLKQLVLLEFALDWLVLKIVGGGGGEWTPRQLLDMR